MSPPLFPSLPPTSTSYLSTLLPKGNGASPPLFPSPPHHPHHHHQLPQHFLTKGQRGEPSSLPFPTPPPHQQLPQNFLTKGQQGEPSTLPFPTPPTTPTGYLSTFLPKGNGVSPPLFPFPPTTTGYLSTFLPKGNGVSSPLFPNPLPPPATSALSYQRATG